MILIDSDVLIWFTRAHPLARIRLTALIAATAIEHGFTLLSGNIRHFGSIEALKLERFES